MDDAVTPIGKRIIQHIRYYGMEGGSIILHIKLHMAQQMLTNSIFHFIISITSDDILLIDQHAAHERILFEKMKKNIPKYFLKKIRPFFKSILNHLQFFVFDGFPLKIKTILLRTKSYTEKLTSAAGRSRESRSFGLIAKKAALRSLEMSHAEASLRGRQR